MRTSLASSTPLYESPINTSHKWSLFVPLFKQIKNAMETPVSKYIKCWPPCSYLIKRKKN